MHRNMKREYVKQYLQLSYDIFRSGWHRQRHGKRHCKNFNNFLDACADHEPEMIKDCVVCVNQYVAVPAPPTKTSATAATVAPTAAVTPAVTPAALVLTTRPLPRVLMITCKLLSSYPRPSSAFCLYRSEAKQRDNKDQLKRPRRLK